MQITRRRFIETGFCAAVGMTLTRARSVAAAQAKTIPIGFQLYSVRGEFARNVVETLKKLSQLGYKAVEFWGYGGTPNVYQEHSAAELRKLLDEHGLQCCGIHLELKALARENLDRAIASSRVLGNQYVSAAAAKEQMHSE